MTVPAALLLIAIVLFVVSAFWSPTVNERPIGLGYLGLAFFAAYFMAGGAA